MTERQYCSDLSLAAGEPLAGTAARVDVWLLLEYKPVWRSKAVTDNDLPAEVTAWLDRQMASVTDRGLLPRLQFIRQPELDREQIAFFAGTSESLYRAEIDGYGAITDLDIATDLGSPSMPRVEASQYFVCTNGQRDLCCARFGLPAYARLRELVGERAWQTTHVGGHRFAPNVLTLPQGVLYGRVRPENVPGFVEDVEAGRLARDHVRGRSALPAEAQAAEIALDGQMLELVGCEAGQVVIRTEKGERRIRVVEADAMEIIASCGDEATECVRPISAMLEQS
ncbi:MAG: hypothetical protein OXI90_08940 [Gammaproteobacteria bacterium]|nr:hypothetical protein [Gammaproteobacteria bacterium]